MAVVSIAILMTFHLKRQASPLEKRVAVPLGLVFWLLALACMVSGLNNYIKTVNKYSRRQALVQSGWGTQVVSAQFFPCLQFVYGGDAFRQVFTIVACAIVAACVFFLSTEAKARTTK
jgi:hypothetical protein